MQIHKNANQEKHSRLLKLLLHYWHLQHREILKEKIMNNWKITEKSFEQVNQLGIE